METCSIAGCTKKQKYVETGWCTTHYMRWWKHGDANYTERDTGPRHVPTEPTKLAYLAGLIDGEGYLAYTKRGYYHLSIQMCDKEVIEWVCATLGGKLSAYPRKHGRRSFIYRWQSNNQGYLRDLLSAVAPYMKLESKKQVIHELLNCS